MNKERGAGQEIGQGQAHAIRRRANRVHDPIGKFWRGGEGLAKIKWLARDEHDGIGTGTANVGRNNTGCFRGTTHKALVSLDFCARHNGETVATGQCLLQRFFSRRFSAPSNYDAPTITIRNIVEQRAKGVRIERFSAFDGGPDQDLSRGRP